MTRDQPLYQQIRAAIETRIMTGVLKPGDRIPFEHELMADYGCSRMTVNKALSALTTAGLIQRQRRAGSFVSQPRIHMAALQIPDIREEIEQRGHVYAMRLLRRAVTTESEGRAFALPHEGELLALQCLHLADGQAFAFEDRLINLAAVPDARAVDFAQVPPGNWLLSHVPWTEAEHRISAGAAGDLAERLDVPSVTACLMLERWTWRDRDPITYVKTVFKGDSFDLTARFLSQAKG